MGIIFILLYLLFLIIYIAFYGYVIHRIWNMRIKGDHTRKGIYLYSIIVVSIITLSFIFLSILPFI